MLLTNGKIFTPDTSCLYVQALAIKNNKILAIGTDEEILKYAGSITQTIDLQGKTVIPGLNNAHDHLAWTAPVGKYYTLKEFSEVGPPKEDVLDSIARVVKTAKPGQWINGNIGLTIFKDRSIRRALDSVAPDHPVYLQVMANNKRQEVSLKPVPFVFGCPKTTGMINS